MPCRGRYWLISAPPTGGQRVQRCAAAWLAPTGLICSDVINERAESGYKLALCWYNVWESAAPAPTSVLTVVVRTSRYMSRCC